MLQILMILSVLLRKYDLHLDAGQSIEATPDGDPAAEAWNPHDLHRSDKRQQFRAARAS